MSAPAQPQALATPAEVAAWLQTTENALRLRRQRGTGPAFIKRGRTIRYAWRDVHSWALAGRSAGGAK
jgi:hypothetical protein